MNLLLAILVGSVSATSNHVVSAPSAAGQALSGFDERCTNPTRHHARKGSVYRGEPIRPQRLTELPKGEAFAAVYRLENGCAVPVLYRSVRQVKPPKP
jgi:hypothetical protein